MNFNLLLDYFINKGKERKSQKKIRRAIKMMRNILTPGKYPEDDPDFAEDEDGEEEKPKDEEKREKKEEDEYDKQLREINTMEIMDEFDKLFKMSYISSTTSLKEQPKPKIITSKIAEVTKSNAGFKRSFFREKTMRPFMKKEKGLDSSDKKEKRRLSKHEIKIDINNINNESKEENELNLDEIKRVDRRMKTYKSPLDMNTLKNNLIGNRDKEENDKFDINKINKKEKKRCMFFSNMIKKEIEQPNIEQMNLHFFNKYHSVYLAKKATEVRVMDYFNKKQLGLKNNKEKNKKTSLLPLINKDKNNIKITENKKSESVKKSEYSRLMDSFGFNRRKHKNQFLY